MGNLRVGAGKRCITPTEDFFPLVGFMGKKGAEAVYDDLFIRTVLLDNGKTRTLFLNLDAGPSLDAVFKDEIEAKYQIPAGQILGVWTHNHSANIKWSHDPAKEKEYKYLKKIVEPAIFGAIDDAVAALQPARYGFGEGKSYINVNRDRLFEDGHWMQGPNFEGPSDKTVAVMKFESLSGNLIAAVVNYGCHANAAFMEPDTDGMIKVSADFPGFASSYVEERYGNGAIWLWTSGCAGNQNPLGVIGAYRKYWPDGYSEAVALPAGSGYIIQKAIGQEHAIDIIQTLKEINRMKENMEMRGKYNVLDLPGHHPEPGVNVRVTWQICDNNVRKTCPEYLVNDRTPPKDTRCKMIQEGVSHLQMMVVELGDVAWVGASGELYSETGMMMKEASPYTHTVVVTHTHDDAMCNGGYILSDMAAEHDTFQFYSSETHPGNNDGRILNNMLKLFDELEGN